MNLLACGSLSVVITTNVNGWSRNHGPYQLMKLISLSFLLHFVHDYSAESNDNWFVVLFLPFALCLGNRVS